MLIDVFLFIVAVLAGALNSVAGGGSFIALPALIYAGVAPVAANATTTAAMWPGSFASAIAYRREIFSARRWVVSLGLVSLIGGLLGGELLMSTSDSRFLKLLPWLMFAAAAMFTLGGTITTRIRDRSGARHGARGGPADGHRAPVWILVLQLVIAIYGGYFGGGMGIMMLAAFAVAGMTDIHEMNGLKVTLALATNGTALAAFLIDDAIVWRPGLVMVAGGAVGGYLGAFMARRFGTSVIRSFIIVVGWVLTVYFFLR